MLATTTATALGLGQLIAGIFGMNLPTALFDEGGGVYGIGTIFNAVSITTCSCILLFLIWLFAYFLAPLQWWERWGLCLRPVSRLCCLLQDPPSRRGPDSQAEPSGVYTAKKLGAGRGARTVGSSSGLPPDAPTPRRSSNLSWLSAGPWSWETPHRPRRASSSLDTTPSPKAVHSLERAPNSRYGRDHGWHTISARSLS